MRNIYKNSETKRKKKPPFPLNFEKISIHRYIPLYLMFCYAYYCENETIVSDSDHDMLCKNIDKYWDNIEHPHKHLVEREAMKTSTGNENSDFYPEIVKSSAQALIYEGVLECKDTKNLPSDFDNQDEGGLGDFFDW